MKSKHSYIIWTKSDQMGIMRTLQFDIAMRLGNFSIHISALLVLCIVAFSAHVLPAQPQDSTFYIPPKVFKYKDSSPTNIVKVGWFRNGVAGSFINAAFERGLRHKLSIQGDLGCMPFNPYGRGLGAYFSYHLGLEGRYYFALNKLPIDGFFVGPYVGFNEVIFYQKSAHRKESLIFWPQVGLTVGVQKVFFKHFVLGIGLKGGYCGQLNLRFYGRDGRLLHEDQLPQLLSVYSQFKFGFKF